MQEIVDLGGWFNKEILRVPFLTDNREITPLYLYFLDVMYCTFLHTSFTLFELTQYILLSYLKNGIKVSLSKDKNKSSEIMNNKIKIYAI